MNYSAPALQSPLSFCDLLHPDGSVTVCAPAKFNLRLEVLGKLPSGLHALRSLMVPLSFGDSITARWGTAAPRDRIECSTVLSDELAAHVQSCRETDPAVASVVADLSSPRNLAARAAEALLQRCANSQPLELQIRKSIPFGAGLGGGSSDAAATLLAVNRLLGQPLSVVQLAEIGAELGSDVPGLVWRCPVFVGGTGATVLPLQSLHESSSLGALSQGQFVIVKPPVSVSTAFAYAQLHRQPLPPDCGSLDQEADERCYKPFGACFAASQGGPACTGNQLTLLPQAGICEGPENGLWMRALGLLSNDFHEVISREVEAVGAACKVLKDGGAEKVMLAGSGSSTAGLVRNEAAARSLEQFIWDRVDRDSGWFVQRCTILNPEVLRAGSCSL